MNFYFYVIIILNALSIGFTNSVIICWTINMIIELFLTMLFDIENRLLKKC